MKSDAVAAGSKSLDVVKFDTFTLLLFFNFVDYHLSVTTKKQHRFSARDQLNLMVGKQWMFVT